MGLAVIVILLAVGMFFVTKFSLSSQQPTEVANSQMKQVAIGFVNTLLSTDANCGGTATFSRLLEEMSAPEYTILACAVDPDAFKTKATQILDKTLNMWGYKYKLTVYYPPNAPYSLIKPNEGVIEINHECLETMDEEAAPPFPIPTDYGDVRVIMKICY